MKGLATKGAVALFGVLLIGGIYLFASRRNTPITALPHDHRANKVITSSKVPASAPADIKRQIEVARRAELAASSILDDLDNVNWDEAKQHLAVLQDASSKLPTPQLSHPDISPMLGDFFQLYTVQLERDCNAEDISSAKLAATVLLGIARDFSTRLEAGPTPELAHFLFLTREFEVWVDARDEQMLRIRARDIVAAWADLRRSLIQKHGTSSVTEFDGVSEELNKANSVDDYTDLLSQIQNAADTISNIVNADASTKSN